MKTSPTKNNAPILSIVILNYNSGEYLKNCLQSLYQSTFPQKKFEIIIADNASIDNSLSLAKTISTPSTKYLVLTTNQGFAYGNNRGIEATNPDSKYLLFLNPDTTVEKDTLEKMVDFFEKNKKVDAATCSMTLVSTGALQPECHRDFPTPLNAFLHFSGISSRQYFMEYLDFAKTQKINACSGAFLMVKREVGNAIGWWNEKYFFYGEDLDFGYKLKQFGFQLWFYPGCKISHFQGISSGIIEKSKHLSKASRSTKIKIAKASTEAMRIFYQENLFSKYSIFTQTLVLGGIKLLEIFRVFKAKYL